MTNKQPSYSNCISFGIFFSLLPYLYYLIVYIIVLHRHSSIYFLYMHYYNDILLCLVLHMMMYITTLCLVFLTIHIISEQLPYTAPTAAEDLQNKKTPTAFSSTISGSVHSFPSKVTISFY